MHVEYTLPLPRIVICILREGGVVYSVNIMSPNSPSAPYNVVHPPSTVESYLYT